MSDIAKRTGSAIESHYRFIVWLVPAIEKFPKSQKFQTVERIQSIALDVLEALIEATYTRERTTHLRRADLGIEKLRFLFRLAADLQLLDRRRYEHAARTLDDTEITVPHLRECGPHLSRIRDVVDSLRQVSYEKRHMTGQL